MWPSQFSVAVSRNLPERAVCSQDRLHCSPKNADRRKPADRCERHARHRRRFSAPSGQKNGRLPLTLQGQEDHDSRDFVARRETECRRNWSAQGIPDWALELRRPSRSTPSRSRHRADSQRADLAAQTSRKPATSCQNATWCRRVYTGPCDRDCARNSGLGETRTPTPLRASAPKTDASAIPPRGLCRRTSLKRCISMSCSSRPKIIHGTPEVAKRFIFRRQTGWSDLKVCVIDTPLPRRGRTATSHSPSRPI